MAKLFLIIICVCTACVHLAWAQMARNGIEQPHKWRDMDFRSAHRHNSELEPLDQHSMAESTDVASDLEYNNQMNPIEMNALQDDDQIAFDRLGNNIKFENNPIQRHKRHAGHSHEEEHVDINPNTQQYIEKIFKKFSNSNDEMNLNEFENMMSELGLDRLIEGKQLNNAIHPEESSRSSSGGSSSSNTDDNHSHDMHSNDTVSNTRKCIQIANSIFGFDKLSK